MKNVKIIDDNLKETTDVIDMDSEIEKEVREIFAESQNKIENLAQRRNKCNFYFLQMQESGCEYRDYL